MGLIGWRKSFEFRDKFVVFSKEFFWFVRLYLVFEELEMFRIGSNVGKRDLVGMLIVFEMVVRNVMRGSLIFWGLENYYRLMRMESFVRVLSLFLVGFDFKDGFFESSSYSLVYRGKVGVFDKVRFLVIVNEESFNFFMGDMSKNCGVVDFVIMLKC